MLKLLNMLFRLMLPKLMLTKSEEHHVAPQEGVLLRRNHTETTEEPGRGPTSVQSRGLFSRDWGRVAVAIPTEAKGGPLLLRLPFLPPHVLPSPGERHGQPFRVARVKSPYAGS